MAKSEISKPVIYLEQGRKIQSGIQEPPAGLPPSSSPDSDTPKVGDKNKRSFLKAAGFAGVALLSTFILPKKAEGLILGSSPTTGVVGVKNAGNTRINPATEETVSTLATEATLDGVLKTTDLALNAGVLDVQVTSTSGAGSSSFSDEGGAAKSGLVDVDRHVQVDVLTSGLPSDAATQTTLNTISFGGTKFALLLATDSVDSNVEYMGEASVGTLTSAASWRIKKIDSATGIVIQWADGDAGFNNVWNNRESLTYS